MKNFYVLYSQKFYFYIEAISSKEQVQFKIILRSRIFILKYMTINAVRLRKYSRTVCCIVICLLVLNFKSCQDSSWKLSSLVSLVLCHPQKTLFSFCCHYDLYRALDIFISDFCFFIIYAYLKLASWSQVVCLVLSAFLHLLSMCALYFLIQTQEPEHRLALAPRHLCMGSDAHSL